MRLTRRDCLIGGAGAALSALLPASRVAAAGDTVGGLAFGTYWRASLPAGADTALATARIEAIIEEIDRTMSPFRADSDVFRFNRARTTDWLPAPAALSTVVAEALSTAHSTDGAFEPTIGPLVGRYGFGPIASPLVGSYAEISVRADAIRKGRPELTVDPCGIAKGYALDRIVAALEALGHPRFLVELGGEVYAAGDRWQIGIERPLPGPLAIQRILGLRGLAVATSGDQYNGYEFAGRRLSHIIDPATGQPVANKVASVSVISPSAMLADAFATALTVMGPERGGELAERLGLPSLFLLHTPDGVEEMAVGGFETYIVA